MGNFSSFIKDFLIPSGVAVGVLAYLFSKLREYKNNKETLRSKRLSLVDKLATDATKINSLFESLRIDAEQNGAFQFRNINTIKPMVARIQSFSGDDLAIFESEKLSLNISELGSFLLSLLTDVDGLENVAQMQINDSKQTKNKLDEDIQKLREKIIPLGFQITPFNLVIRPKIKKNDKQYDSILSALSEVQSIYNSSMAKINSLNQVINDRRIFYCMKLLDSQGRLRNLLLLLDEARIEYAKRNWLTKLLIKISF